MSFVINPYNYIVDAGGLVAWYDPSDSGTLTTTGSDVSQIDNKGSEASIDATQSSGGAQPTTAARGIGGVNILDYDGNDWMTLGVETIGNTGLFCDSGESFSVMVVGIADGQGTFFGRAGATGSSRQFQFLWDNGFTDLGLNLRGTSNQISTGINTGTSFIMIFTWDGSTATAYVHNGSSGTTCSVGTAAEETGQDIIIGARTNGTGFFINGGIGEIKIWDTALSLSEVNTEGSALGTKYSITWTTKT